MVELRIGVRSVKFIQKRFVLVPGVEVEPIGIRSIHKVLPILIQCYVLSRIVQILKLAASVPGPSVGSLNIGRPNQT